MRYLALFPALVVVAGCDLIAPLEPSPVFGPTDASSPIDPAAPSEVVETAEVREDTGPDASEPVAEAPRPSAGGDTVASLGDPARAGLWLETPLVSAQSSGTVRVKETGRNLEVTLIPIPGEATAGSRLSVEAMRALGVGLADLVELQVTVAG